MNTEKEDRLKSLFQEIKSEEPSFGFESRLMQNIHIVAAKQSRKESFRKKLITSLAIAGGIIGIFSIPASIFWLLGWSLTDDIKPMHVDLNITMPKFHADPFIISIATVTILLLVCDTLIRKRIWEKKHKV